jgi:hypothetical protein
MSAQPTSGEHQRKIKEMRERAIAAFPFERIETTGERALARWHQAKSAGYGSPVVIGGDDDLGRLAEAFGPEWPSKPLDEILAEVTKLQHPRDLQAMRDRESREALQRLKEMLEKQPDMPLPKVTIQGADGNVREQSREEVLEEILKEPEPPQLGEWPASAGSMPELSVAYQMLSGIPLAKAYIALIPTDDWTTIPAHMRWGNWNSCPPPEYHVAALRSWRDRYGAELVGLGSDTMNLRVTRRPDLRQEALDLAREQYAYCSDIIDQGAQSLSNLAASLMASDWWYFWWD